MRIDIYFHDYKDKSESNRTLEVLQLYLNKHTIMKNYSSVYNSISFKFLNNPPKKREAKVLMPYGVHPEVEILSHFEDNRKLSVEVFHLALGLLKEAIPRIPYAPTKKEFDFDVEELLKDIIISIKDAPNSKQELKFLDDNKKQFTLQNRLNHKLRIIQNFRENPRPLDTRIIGVRIFSNIQFDDGDDDVYFYQNMYSIIFSDVLYWYDIRLPGYKEIYIELVESVEEAIDISTSKDDWFQYTHAILDYTTFKQASQEIKEQLLLKSLIEGLRYITDFDHLEVNKIEGAIEYIQKHKLKTPLTYSIKENDEYKVTIHYKVTRETIIRNYVKAIYNIHIFQKATGKESVNHLGIFETFNVPYILGNITLTKKQVTIKGRKGLRAEVYRSSEKAPIEFKFEFQKMFLTNEEGDTVG
ncbi:hypothetical protein CN514_09695 [Bacillus sp. AFS001701]|uniref:hypothetical protein n=1 Tax=unclassified Bacillus (in: firmicutes) TaxID=185979 RepID=UPI000BF93F91|nr:MULTISPECIES: hypothetical protein [unclassified Bacillus (in: firmicutes)]PET68750.1 hypothetical protein CN514_09695 [Bacillus sp. AFS001701]PFH83597.1 hypothetical protein COI44_17470 [Bacillus sp. AFS088145]